MEEYFIEEKTNYERFLDFLVMIAVFVVTIFLILELIGPSTKTNLNLDKLNTLYYQLNIGVFVIFILDLIRLWKHSNGVKDFVSKNWLDIIATIPFGLIANKPTFEILKLTRFQKFFKLSKVSRSSKIVKEFKAASHLKSESEEYKRKHRL